MLRAESENAESQLRWSHHPAVGHDVVCASGERAFTDYSITIIQTGPAVVIMKFDFGMLGQGVVLHHVTSEGPLMQRAR